MKTAEEYAAEYYADWQQAPMFVEAHFAQAFARVMADARRAALEEAAKTLEDSARARDYGGDWHGSGVLFAVARTIRALGAK